jgi:hypothetical protein
MARYDQVFATLARRAVEQGISDVRSLIEIMRSAGASDEAVLQTLLDDFDNDGPIFGRFSRSLKGAAGNAVMAAMRQGQMVSDAMENDKLRQILRERGYLERAIDALETGDPEAAEDVIAQASADAYYMWVAELRNTCHLCLPLHGKAQTALEWQQAGLDPSTIHASAGWSSECKCRLVLQDPADTKALRGQMAPLRRVPLAKGEKKTVRRIDQQGIEGARAAVEAARQSPDGMRVLRKLGQANAGEAEE